MKFHVSAACGVAVGFLVLGLSPAARAQDRLDANGMPTTHSTPAERAQTATLNRQIQQNNQAADAQAAAANARYQAQQQHYRDQQQQYHEQMQQNAAQQQRYVDQTAQYENLRDRYASERHAYRRHLWPNKYRDWVVARDERLIGSRVEITDGDHVGTVESVARKPSGDVEGLRVRLDGGKVVWIDQSDIRFDRDDGLVMTDLDRADLHQMADEQL
jgi:hypothetical protein